MQKVGSEKKKKMKCSQLSLSLSLSVHKIVCDQRPSWWKMRNLRKSFPTAIERLYWVFFFFFVTFFPHWLYKVFNVLFFFFFSFSRILPVTRKRSSRIRNSSKLLLKVEKGSGESCSNVSLVYWKIFNFFRNITVRHFIFNWPTYLGHE